MINRYRYNLIGNLILEKYFEDDYLMKKISCKYNESNRLSNINEGEIVYEFYYFSTLKYLPSSARM